MTTEQIAEILAGIRSEGDGNAGEKRRRAIRVKRREPVTIVPCQDGQPRTPQAATLVDFSSRGVALHFLQPIMVGAHFLLVLPSALSNPVQLLCDVVHCRKRSDGKYAIGAEFVGVPTVNSDTSEAPDPSETSRISGSILK